MPKGLSLKRFAVLASIATVIAVAIIAGAVILANLPSADEPKRLTRQIQVDASKEKTHFLGPLRSDGTIDYVAAINQQLSEGVTPENNAFAVLVKVLRPMYWFDDGASAVLQAMNISENEMEGVPVFTNWHDTYRNHIKANDEISEDETKALLNDLLDEPLTAESAEQLTKWVRINREALSICDAGLERERYWIPLIDEPGGNGLLVSIWLPHSHLIRELALCYRAQLVLAAKDGNADVAQRALRSLLRLAKLHSNTPSLIGGLVAISVEAQAIFAIRNLLNQGQVEGKVLAKLAEEWAESDGRVPIVNHIDIWERCMSLDGLMQIASGRSDTNEIFDGMSEQNLIDQLFIDERFNISDGLSIVQADFDRLIRAMKKTDYAACAEALTAFETEFDQRSEVAQAKLIIPARDQNTLNNQMQNPEHTQVLTHWYLSVMMPALSAAYRTDMRVTANYRNCYAAIAIERYLADQGELPDSLAQLLPTYLPAVPQDPFDQQELKYRRIMNGYSVYSLGDNLRDDGGVHDFVDGDIAIMVERFDASE